MSASRGERKNDFNSLVQLTAWALDCTAGLAGTLSSSALAGPRRMSRGREGCLGEGCFWEGCPQQHQGWAVPKEQAAAALSTPPATGSSQHSSPSIPYIYLTLMRRIDWNDGICKGRGVKVHKTSLSGAAISGPMGLVGEIKGLVLQEWRELTAITFQMCA